jgi:hypothetical protein
MSYAIGWIGWNRKLWTFPWMVWDSVISFSVIIIEQVYMVHAEII